MEFDDDWINNFKVNPKRVLKVFYCYVDKESTLNKINQEIIEMSNDLIKRDELIRMIVSNKKKHQLVSILTYNVGEVTENTNFHDFLNSSKIQDIEFEKSHQALEGTNSLFFIFKEYSKKLKSNSTRKVYISSSRNTKRKRLKANTTDL